MTLSDGGVGMAILVFADVLKKAGLDPAKVKLIRHSLADEGFRRCYDKNMVREYTAHQKRASVKVMTIGRFFSVKGAITPDCTAYIE